MICHLENSVCASECHRYELYRLSCLRLLGRDDWIIKVDTVEIIKKYFFTFLIYEAAGRKRCIETFLTKSFSISVLFGNFKDVKWYLQLDSVGSFFRIKTFGNVSISRVDKELCVDILSKSFCCAGHADVSLANVAKICTGKDACLIHIQEQVGIR